MNGQLFEGEGMDGLVRRKRWQHTRDTKFSRNASRSSGDVAESSVWLEAPSTGVGVQCGLWLTVERIGIPCRIGCATFCMRVRCIGTSFKKIHSPDGWREFDVIMELVSRGQSCALREHDGRKKCGTRAFDIFAEPCVCGVHGSVEGALKVRM